MVAGTKTLERRCIVERQTADKQELLRFVLGPDDVVFSDLKCNLPGRGVWVGAKKSLVQTAVLKKLFARGFKTKCSAPADLADLIDRQLEARCLGLLSLAKKAGQIVTGFEKVLSRIKAEDVEILFSASDGAKDGIQKLERLFAKTSRDGAVINLFSSDQMNLALGSENVIHAAITRGTMAKNILAAVKKLENYRS